MTDARPHPHGLGVPGASAPPPPWLVLLSGVVTRLRGEGTRRDQDFRPSADSARAQAAAHTVAALVLLAGWRPIPTVEIPDGDVRALYLAGAEALLRDVLAEPPGARDAAALATLAALHATARDAVDWIAFRE